MKSYQTFLKATALSACVALPNIAFADVASGISYNSSVDCDSNKATPDEKGVIYGTDDTSRQWLNIYEASGSGTKPVFLYAHANGGSACNVNNPMKATITAENYTIVSWESHSALSTSSETQDAWADAELVMAYLRANAAHFNLDMSNIIVAGRSRGSGASWKLAHSDSSVRGIYMPQALPDPFWESLSIWDPATDVTVDSKPIYMPYKPSTPDITGDIHDPRRGLDIVDRYAALGLGHKASVDMGVAEDALFDYFPTFLESLDTTTPVLSFSDDFSDGQLDPSYTAYGNDAWEDRNFSVLENADSSVSTFLVNGDINASDYTVSARLKTRNQRNAGAKNWEGARLVARISDSTNYYEAYLKTDGQLLVKSIVNGSVNTLLNISVGLDPLIWHDLAIKAQGSQIEIILNNAPIAVINNTDHSSGQAGVKSNFCECRFDDLVISP